MAITLSTLTIEVEKSSVELPLIENDIEIQRISYAGAVGAFRTSTITEEIFQAMSGARIEPDEDGSRVVVTIPMKANKAALDSVIAAHDKTIPSTGELKAAAVDDAIAALNGGNPIGLLYPDIAAITDIAGVKAILVRLVGILDAMYTADH